MPGMEAENPMAAVAREVPGIDAIILGHTHAEFADTTINGVLLVQPRNWATSVAVATLTVERDGKAWRVAGKHGAIVRVAGHAERQDVLDGSAAAHAAARKYATATVGATSTEWRSDSARTRDTPVMDFIGEVMRRASGADLASTAVFSTNIAIPKGPLTVAQIARLYPYDNTMRVVKMSGTTLKAFLERSAQYYRVTGSGADLRAAPDPAFIGFNFEVVSGASYDVDLSRPSGDRIVGLAVKGRPVAPTDSFTIALSNYRASGTGGYAMVADARVVKDDSREVRQLLIDEITRKKDLKATDYYAESWHLGPAPLAAQVQQAIAGQGDFEAVRRPPTAPATGKATTLRILSTAPARARRSSWTAATCSRAHRRRTSPSGGP
jgi:2',3'-cyclic-nucleotide 2'-phosphodiesterase/3'-nucleotidase